METIGCPVPSVEPKPPLRFAGFILDLDACVLARESGEIVALTRSEFVLLRFLVSRPGRVASRESLLDAIANRRFAPFDRNVDVVVGRLRRKIEFDPKRPSAHHHRAGEGYRFDGLTLPWAPEVKPADARADLQETSDDPPNIRAAPGPRARLPYLLTAAGLALTLTLAGLWGRSPANPPAPTPLPSVTVLPFANLTGDIKMDYLGPMLAREAAAFLGACPGLRVIAADAPAGEAARGAVEAPRLAGARYVVQGGVDRLADRLRVTATLFDGANRTAVWSQVFDSSGNDSVGLREDVSRFIYELSRRASRKN